MKPSGISKWKVLGIGFALTLAPATFGADQQPPQPPAGRQRGGSPEMQAQRAQEQLKKLVEELKLTDAQKQKVEANMKAQTEATRKLAQDTSLTQEQRREKMRTLREDNDKKMKEVLTAEQFEKWQKLRQEQMQNMRRPGGQGQGQGQGNRPQRPPGQGSQPQ